MICPSDIALDRGVIAQDSVTPGSTIPLFSGLSGFSPFTPLFLKKALPCRGKCEVLFNFSSTVSPLLYNASRALHLPARSSESFNSVFGTSKFNYNRFKFNNNKGDTNAEAAPPIVVQYTGHILVSGYNISFILPKVFLSPLMNGGLSDNEEESFSRTPRLPSAGERSQ